jgi:hypothetical protein
MTTSKTSKNEELIFTGNLSPISLEQNDKNVGGWETF